MRRKRLLAETDERAAELAIINERPAAAWPQKLDMQAMYELVGDRIQEIFDAQVVDIGVVDREPDSDPLPVHDRARRAVPRRADADRSGSRRHVIETAQPLLDQRDVPATRRWRWARQPVHPGRAGRSRPSSCRSSSATRSAGVISLQNLDREDAFSEADVGC